MKQKFKMNDLAAKPLELELEHPVIGKTGIKIKLLGPHSQQVRDAFGVFEASEKKEDDQLKLFANCLLGWDEEAFEMPFSVENAMKFFRVPENAWAASFIGPKLKDPNIFFRAKG